MNNEAAGIKEMQEGTIFVWPNTLLFKPVPESLCERGGDGCSIESVVPVVDA